MTTPATAGPPPQPAACAEALALQRLPGHQIRRLQQIAVAIFLQETEGHGITPVQYAALQTVANEPDIDQRSLAARIGFDTSTIGGVVDRLEARGLLRRQVAAHDRRLRQLRLTDAGADRLARLQPAKLAAQARILAPLPEADRQTFVRLLDRLVEANNALSRAPSAAAEDD